MKKFVLGLIVGLALPHIKRYYDFGQLAKENPEDPRVLEVQERRVEVKAAFRKLIDQMKADWVKAKTDVDFKDIVRDIEDK